MRWLGCACLLAILLPAAAAPLPSVIIDIHDRGYAEVQALREHADVRWSAEFGNELLLGVDEAALARWLKRADVRPGPLRLAFDEVVVREHACNVHDPRPAVAVIGGYEILRQPPALARIAALSGISGAPLPKGGVVAREVNNSPRGKGLAAPDPLVAAVVARVDAERWFQTMSDLATFNRSSYSSELGAAHDWVSARFAAAGLETSSHGFTLSSSLCSSQPAVDLLNPIGFKRGRSRADEWIVIGAHYDSRNDQRCDGSEHVQPGANDNASGCAGVIELARVFEDVPTERSLLFACFSGEEQGLAGSHAYVQALTASGDIGRVLHMINLDMIGHAIDDSLSARVESTTAHQSWLDKYAVLAITYAPELNLILSTETRAYSDHWPFLQAGVPAVFTWENGAAIYPHWHQVTDVPANMLRARELAAGILRMDAAMLAGLGDVAGVFASGFEVAH
jgi:hypothetical protein